MLEKTCCRYSAPNFFAGESRVWIFLDDFFYAKFSWETFQEATFFLIYFTQHFWGWHFLGRYFAKCLPKNVAQENFTQKMWHKKMSPKKISPKLWTSIYKKLIVWCLSIFSMLSFFVSQKNVANAKIGHKTSGHTTFRGLHFFPIDRRYDCFYMPHTVVKWV